MLASFPSRRYPSPRPDVPLLIGIDEAGYGPNLGPLLAATVWEIPGHPPECDLFAEFSGVGARSRFLCGKRVADRRFQTGLFARTGLVALELGVHSGMGLKTVSTDSPSRSSTFHELVRSLHAGPGGRCATNHGMPLPNWIFP